MIHTHPTPSAVPVTFVDLDGQVVIPRSDIDCVIRKGEIIALGGTPAKPERKFNVIYDACHHCTIGDNGPIWEHFVVVQEKAD